MAIRVEAESLSAPSTFTNPSAWHDNIVAASSLWPQILGYVETSGEAYILTAERVRTSPIFIAIPIQWYNIRFYILVLLSNGLTLSRSPSTLSSSLDFPTSFVSSQSSIDMFGIY
jgi:hypothetical protein